MTTVAGVVRRSRLGYGSFADITSVPVAAGGIARDGITFDGDLTAEEYDAIWARMDSTDDADMARRAVLRADRDVLAEADPLRRLYDYMLGD